jgi:uncharacterized C2H2 Zn-finger protein
MEETGLRGRINKDYYDVKNRPKTPRHLKKKTKEKAVNGEKKEPIITPKEKQNQLNDSKSKNTKNKDIEYRLFVCPNCDKSYKTKKGCIKHVRGCIG